MTNLVKNEGYQSTYIKELKQEIVTNYPLSKINVSSNPKSNMFVSPLLKLILVKDAHGICIFVLTNCFFFFPIIIIIFPRLITANLIYQITFNTQKRKNTCYRWKEPSNSNDPLYSTYSTLI